MAAKCWLVHIWINRFRGPTDSIVRLKFRGVWLFLNQFSRFADSFVNRAFSFLVTVCSNDHSYCLPTSPHLLFAHIATVIFCSQHHIYCLFTSPHLLFVHITTSTVCSHHYSYCLLTSPQLLFAHITTLNWYKSRFLFFSYC